MLSSVASLESPVICCLGPLVHYLQEFNLERVLRSERWMQPYTCALTEPFVWRSPCVCASAANSSFQTSACAALCPGNIGAEVRNSLIRNNVFPHGGYMMAPLSCFCGIFLSISSFQRLSCATEGLMLGAATLRNLEILNNQVNTHPKHSHLERPAEVSAWSPCFPLPAAAGRQTAGWGAVCCGCWTTPAPTLAGGWWGNGWANLSPMSSEFFWFSFCDM